MKKKIMSLVLAAAMAFSPMTALAEEVPQYETTQVVSDAGAVDSFSDGSDASGADVDIFGSGEVAQDMPETATDEATDDEVETYFFTVNLTKGGKVILNEGEDNEQTVQIVAHGDTDFVVANDKNGVLLESMEAEANGYSYLLEEEPTMITVKALADEGYETTNLEDSSGNNSGFSAPAC